MADFSSPATQGDSLLAALREIASLSGRTHPVAGYMFDVDPRKIAAAALDKYLVEVRAAYDRGDPLCSIPGFVEKS